MRFAVQLQMRSPLAISLGRATGNQLQTARHIPGSVWRGAVAAAFIREHDLGENAHKDPDFSLLFLQQKVRFGDLLPSASRPWPLSARWCKQQREQHRIIDLLVGDPDSPNRPLECVEESQNQQCGSKLSPPDGFYSGGGRQPRPVALRLRLTAHTAIENSSLRARSAQFFTTEVLESKHEFNGWLWAAPEVKDLLARVFRQSEQELFLGRGTTRGQGRAAVTINAQAQSPSKVESLKESLRALNHAYGRSGEVVFSCTLLSPCIVYDRWLCARSWLTAEDIGEAVGYELSGYALHSWFSKTIPLSGWHAAAQLPKPDATAIAPGSVFLFKKKVQEAGRESEYQALAQALVACTGIGERWEEGLGEAEFCDDFHVHQRWNA